MDSPDLVRRVALLSLHSSPTAPLGRSDAGGMNLYVRRVADDLARMGVEVDVFTRRSDPRVPEVERSASGARYVQLQAGPVRKLPKSVLPLHIPAMVTALRQFAHREDARYDVVHSHYWISGLVAMRAGADPLLNGPFLHMFHTLARLKAHYAGGPDPADSALRADGERCLIGRADVIVGATAEEQDEMVRLYGRTPARYEVIPPGLDTGLFTPRDRLVARRRLGITASRVLVFVGRMDRLKGVELLLRSVAALPAEQRNDLCVLLVGGGDPRVHSDAARYRALAGKLDLDAVVRFCGTVPHAELPLYYSAADICVVPSAYESFGMAAVEAMACATPVVAFRVGGLATTIRDGHTGFLVPAGDDDAFAACLSAALEYPSLERMGRQARLSVQQYAWSTIVDRTYALYRDVVAREAFTDRRSALTS